jgi:putative FmdB family regulatory protein
MPIFEFVCGRCGKRFSVLTGVVEPETRCVRCGGAATRKFSSFATPGLGRPRSRLIRDDAMRSLLPYFAPRD